MKYLTASLLAIALMVPLPAPLLAQGRGGVDRELSRSEKFTAQGYQLATGTDINGQQVRLPDFDSAIIAYDRAIKESTGECDRIYGAVGKLSATAAKRKLKETGNVRWARSVFLAEHERLSQAASQQSPGCFV